MALVGVRVYYKTCSETVRGLAHFPETLASFEGLSEVPGTCLKNAAEKAGFPPKMHCSSNGEWLVPVGRCLCIIGFEEVDGECVGRYSKRQTRRECFFRRFQVMKTPGFTRRKCGM